MCFGVRWAWSEVGEVVEGAQIAAAGGLRYLMTAHLSEFLADEGGRQAEGREHAGGGSVIRVTTLAPGASGTDRGSRVGSLTKSATWGRPEQHGDIPATHGSRRGL